MNKEEIISQINEHYRDFVIFINELSEEEFNLNLPEKWSAKQQLQHVILCVEPLVRVYKMPKHLIEQTFGNTNKSNNSYEEILEKYLSKLKNGGKAPSLYVPKATNIFEKESLVNTLQSLIKGLNLAVSSFSEMELEALCIPHPLLGTITLKEMLFNAIYHVKHHHLQAKNNLNSNNEK